MSFENSPEYQQILNQIRSENEGKFGIICLNCLIVRGRFKEIYDFMERHNVPFPQRDNLSKLELLDHISIHFYEQFEKSKTLRKKFKTPLNYIGSFIINDIKLKDYLTRFDFISKQELIDAFADYCADYGISVYNTKNIKDFSLDLYLIKKKPFLRTESVFVRTGTEMTEESYKNTFYLISEASKVSIWTVFVTTPLGVCNIGLERLINDMERLNTWLYVIDPIHQKVLGIVKGKKSKNHSIEVRDAYISQLPHEPIRTSSQIAKISKYHFKESEAYNPKSYTMFEMFPKEKLVEEEHAISIRPKYKSCFRDLLIIERVSGLPMFSHSSEDFPMDKELVSGFLSAMDSFVSEIGGSTSMNEISYKGFYVHAAYGKYIKLALFLSEPANQSLKERLFYFLNQFEVHYEDQIKKFVETGNSAIFNKEKIAEIVKELLSV
ncbi:MAG: hypothetical protein ACTSUC_15140 [Promethearchaeota archaeon]